MIQYIIEHEYLYELYINLLENVWENFTVKFLGSQF
jgi:hypothetical protein